jgi:hypothetical protein
MNLIKWDYLTVLADLNPAVFDANGQRKYGLDAKLINNMLAQFGAEGWELVSTSTVNFEGTTIQVSYIFKKMGTAKTSSEFRRIGFDLDGDGENEIVNRG